MCYNYSIQRSRYLQGDYIMPAGYLKFDSIPEIGFAHHHYSGKYMADYEKVNNSFEIVYINSGTIIAEFNDKRFYLNEGDIFVLFRHLPINIYTPDDKEHSHCTVQLEFDYAFELVEPIESFPDDGIILPFVTKRCALTNEIKKDLYGIVHQISASPERYSFSASLKALEIMKKLDNSARDLFNKTNPHHAYIAKLVESYVKDNLYEKIYLKDISVALGKSPNYINFAFKKAKGTTITNYINEEKISVIAALMQKQNMHFTKACNSVGISDSSYGYRLFKKYTGLTPNMFLKSEKILQK